MGLIIRTYLQEFNLYWNYKLGDGSERKGKVKVGGFFVVVIERFILKQRTQIVPLAISWDLSYFLQARTTIS